MTKTARDDKPAARPDIDALEMLRFADHADWMLLRTVGCVAFATLLLAAAGSLLR